LCEAAIVLETAIKLAKNSHDRWLASCARLMRADVLCQLSRLSLARELLCETAREWPALTPDLNALYERVLACELGASGRLASGEVHFLRAKRIYETIQHSVGAQELERYWKLSVSRLSAASSQDESDKRVGQSSQGARILHSIASVILSLDHSTIVA